MFEPHLCTSIAAVSSCTFDQSRTVPMEMMQVSVRGVCGYVTHPTRQLFTFLLRYSLVALQVVKQRNFTRRWDHNVLFAWRTRRRQIVLILIMHVFKCLTMSTKSLCTECPYIYIYMIYRMISKVVQSEVWYLVLTRNNYDEVELLDEYVGMPVQNLCKGKRRSRDLTPSQ